MRTGYIDTEAQRAREDGEIDDTPVTFKEVVAVALTAVWLVLGCDAALQVMRFWLAGGFS